MVRNFFSLCPPKDSYLLQLSSCTLPRNFIDTASSHQQPDFLDFIPSPFFCINIGQQHIISRVPWFKTNQLFSSNFCNFPVTMSTTSTEQSTPQSSSWLQWHACNQVKSLPDVPTTTKQVDNAAIMLQFRWNPKVHTHRSKYLTPSINQTCMSTTRQNPHKSGIIRFYASTHHLLKQANPNFTFPVIRQTRYHRVPRNNVFISHLIENAPRGLQVPTFTIEINERIPHVNSVSEEPFGIRIRMDPFTNIHIPQTSTHR
ncbi:hypothetical protein V8G54_028919 [Vigna mungo]|uniref:Uncharacterized protein n=1 Tax=Vigna mungo TaxID=3915 RepID=A0AAQ3RIM5_VIGMU